MIARVVVTSFKSLRQKHFKLQIQITTEILFFGFEENTILKTFSLIGTFIHIILMRNKFMQHINNLFNIIKASSVQRPLLLLLPIQNCGKLVC